MRPGWWATLVLVIAVVPVLVLLLIDELSTPTTNQDVRTTPAVVFTLIPGVNNYQASDYSVTVTISADRPLHLSGLELELCHQQCPHPQSSTLRRLRPSSGDSFDIGPRAEGLTLTGRAPVGTYIAHLRYRLGRTWHDLPPYTVLRVS